MPTAQQALPDGFDLLELLYYFFGFWLFIFHGEFRRAALERWRSRSGLRHAATCLEIASSVFCGVVIPAFLFGLL